MSIRVKNLTHIYEPGLPTESVALEDVSFEIEDGELVGIIGHTGCGKSTLLHLIVGELTPDSGTVDIGTTVKIGHFSQEGRELDLE